ncbi:MAG: FAD-binding protein [Coriobacteriaceae bacterium]|nr:FAD-binding protein [Coriobacteriaceae bacterium]
MRNIDRRDFIKGTLGTGALLAAGTGLAACSTTPDPKQDPAGSNTEMVPAGANGTAASYSFETPPPPIPQSDITETVESDVVVVGGGPAGFVAAVRAAEKGAKVTLISDAKEPVSHGGDYFGANTAAMKAAGLPKMDMPAILPIRFRDNSYNIDQDKWYLLLNKNPEAIDWLTEKMESNGYKTIFLDGYTDPDSGEVFVYGGTHQWVQEGEALGTSGVGVLAVLSRLAEEAGIRMDFLTAGKQLVRDDGNAGRVSAVIAQTSDGSYRKYAATKGIILATGDFTADNEMMRKYCPDYADLDGHGAYSGDGHKMGLWVGAAWQKTTPNAPMAETLSGNVATANSLLAFSGLTVNLQGRRYSNENCGIGHACHAQMRQPSQTAVCIWDIDYAQAAGPWSESWTRGSDPATLPDEWKAAVGAEPMTFMGMAPMTMLMADTIEDLASQLGCDPATLKATVDRYNALCEAGVDEDFGKNHRMMIPIKKPPFFAHYGRPWLLVCTGGLRANTKMQVLDDSDKVIEGLYVAGTIVGDVYSIYDFIFGGIHLGLNCTTFGYIAGEEAASR